MASDPIKSRSTPRRFGCMGYIPLITVPVTLENRTSSSPLIPIPFGVCQSMRKTNRTNFLNVYSRLCTWTWASRSSITFLVAQLFPEGCVSLPRRFENFTLLPSIMFPDMCLPTFPRNDSDWLICQFYKPHRSAEDSSATIWDKNRFLLRRTSMFDEVGPSPKSELGPQTRVQWLSSKG